MKTDPIKLRTFFMGTSNFAAAVLTRLIKNNFNVVGVVTAPDKPVGRNKEIRPSPVKQIAEEQKLEILQPDAFNDKEIQKIRQIKPDIIVVVAYGKILPNSILGIPGFGCLNIHGSLLPLFRGPSPIQNALISGCTITGISIILMNEKIDSGDIIAARSLPIESIDDYTSLSKKMSELASDTFMEILPNWIERKIEPIKQDEEKATFCQLIERSDGKIFWADSAESIFNKYRAFVEWPQIHTFWNRTDEVLRLKLLKISLLNNNSSKEYRTGQVFKAGECIGVQTGYGSIIIEQIQVEGKNPMAIGDFINGYPDFIGSIIE